MEVMGNDAVQVHQSIAAARVAFSSWAAVSIGERESVIRRFVQVLEQHRAELVLAICQETGKPRWESNTEVDSMIAKAAISIEARTARRQATEAIAAGATTAVRYKPLGVAVVLGPFNFPGHLPNGHIIPALLAGNTVVFKPSELAPNVGELTVRCWHEAGLPAGVINLIQGGREVGEALVAHPDINAVLFTGSFNGGRAISRTLADRPDVITALEMGGNNPLIVHGVGDLNAAAYLTIQSAFISAGQRCSCARRLIVPDGNDGFIDALVKMMAGIRVGSFDMEPPPFMGRVISDAAADRLLNAQRELQSRGARSIVEMRPIEGQGKSMLGPGLIDVTEVRDRPDEELFGPLLQLVRVKDFDEAMREANNTKYGLAAGLFCDDPTLYQRFFQASGAGVVNWNRALTGASSRLPFGGIGRSGNGRPSAFFAADYCDYAVASMEVEKVAMPEKLAPGIEI
jgi:succinylglutamic semialdehyde dehydrogenase